MNDKKSLLELIKERKSIIWDFDGVIKDSVYVKGEVFKKLFIDQDEKIQEKIFNHHNSNGGISRFQKLKTYLDWSSHEVSKKNINLFASKFSNLVIKEVINSNYIDGVKEYLEKNFKRQNFYLVTATPQKEIHEITKELGIFSFFKKIFGYPLSKNDSFKSILENSDPKHSEFIVIGDSFSEYQAAKQNHIDFILRIDKSQEKIPEWYIEKDRIIKNFIFG